MELYVWTCQAADALPFFGSVLLISNCQFIPAQSTFYTEKGFFKILCNLTDIGWIKYSFKHHQGHNHTKKSDTPPFSMTNQFTEPCNYFLITLTDMWLETHHF